MKYVLGIYQVLLKCGHMAHMKLGAASYLQFVVVVVVLLLLFFFIFFLYISNRPVCGVCIIQVAEEQNETTQADFKKLQAEHK